MTMLSIYRNCVVSVRKGVLFLLLGHLIVQLPVASKLLLYEPRSEKTGISGFPTRSDTNQAVQLQNMVRGLEFCI